MVDFGAACLIASLVAFGYGGVAAIVGGKTNERRWVISARRAVYSACALLTIAVVILEISFVRDDFSVALVADHSSTTTPTGYKLTALWSSQGGSLLLWAWVLSMASSAVLYATRNRHREIVPWATAVLCGLGLFFTGLMLFAGETNPFARMSPVPAEGLGLTPLLRHPAMAIHPPMLYSGYVFFSIPFAFAVGALISRRLDASWIRITRRFALIAWIFLSIGILLGSRWSYSELGWGGYWGWDPVENASVMPWLIGTAFLHSIMVQERRGMLKVWNVSLIVATFTLSLLGTFLVRSGILESIHAFGASTVGTPLLALIGVVLVASTALIVSRLGDLRSERRLESLASRESIFLVNNLLLVGLCAIIFWGTFFPLISEALTGEKSSLAAPWFDDYTTPLAILLVLFTGVGPLLAWRKINPDAIKRMFLPPLGFAAVVVAFLVAFTDSPQHPVALIMFGICAFTFAGLAGEFARGASAQRALTGASWPTALGRVIGRNRRRYGGYTVHVGIVVLFVGVAASSSFQTSRDVRLTPGQSASVGDYRVTYKQPTSSIDAKQQSLSFGAILAVERNGKPFTTLHPSRSYFSNSSSDPSEGIRGFFEGEATSEVGRRESAGGDLWTAMRPDLAPLDPEINRFDRQLTKLIPSDIAPTGPTPTQLQAMKAIPNLEGLAIRKLSSDYPAAGVPVDFRVNVNPLVIWLWLGGGISVLGALLAIWPAASAKRRRVSDVYAARIAKELSVERHSI
ncbi:cytochrome c biogenesis protein CcsA [soil metagenome]